MKLAEGGDDLFGELFDGFVGVWRIEVDDYLVDADVRAGLHPFAPIVHVSGHSLALASEKHTGLLGGYLRQEIVIRLLTFGRNELNEDGPLDIVEVSALIEAVLAQHIELVGNELGTAVDVHLIGVSGHGA